MKIDNFLGDLTDISAIEKKPLILMNRSGSFQLSASTPWNLQNSMLCLHSLRPTKMTLTLATPSASFFEIK